MDCDCKSLPDDAMSFATGFTAPKVNTIDFDKIFANLPEMLAENQLVYSTVLAIFFLYILLLVWARHMDKKDIEKVT